jgi:signal transduction histidine kinase/phage shock protein PspC (stress-responsive transcriptional regulator)
MEASAPHRTLFARSRSDRMLAGVAGGIAERLDIDAVVIRLAFVALALAGGFGIVAYLIAWLVAAEPPVSSPAGGTAERPIRPTGTRQVVAVALVSAGAMLLLREVGVWFGDALAWSVGLASFGSAILWTRADDSGRARFAKLASRIPRSPADAMAGRSKGRLAVGALLVVAGMGTFIAANTSWSAMRNVAFAVMVTVVGLGLVLGPWIYELFRQLTSERRERIRSEERAEVNAHLHDSVLQTLAMIQRAPTPQEMASLARGQERELRAWLYGRSRNGSDTLSAALDETAARVETMHKVAVDTVVVGDVAMDDGLRALVDAAGEAMNNAAKHSGAKAISVYAEVTDESIGVYVRDEGAGFDASAVTPGRRGIAESIVGRMERNGGVATIQSVPAEGTEVHLVMPRKPI